MVAMPALVKDKTSSDADAVKISLRAPKAVRDKIDRAAEVRNVTRTEFMLRVAAAAANETLLDQRLFSFGADRWAQFQAALNAPLPNSARLKALLRKKPAWER
jgi:uncharacterized protein (DUF1778 family)